MDAIEFVTRYPEFIQEIRAVVRPELFPLVDELESIDPHDLIRPEAWFSSENDARGFVWTMFMKLAKKDLMAGTKSQGRFPNITTIPI